ncbi:type VI secretion system Vgr family protein [Variovorax rhizosphaerae]|uniref:Type VI secretion system tip protein TssI/VgrG n=1 Tax=Variovorax rhizosphaerae TaxID=1836200 RepID=A0ABU8WC20_9BURK
MAAEFQIKSESPVASDLMFWSIAGHEGLSRASFYELTVLSENGAITAKDILGHAFDIVIQFQDSESTAHQRHCQGHATRFIRLNSVGRYFEYRITLRSWFWLLTKRTNSRILQDKAVLAVMDEVIEDSPIKRLKKLKSKDVIGTHKPHTYCVQYQESDHAFLSRLLEEEGIYYWFDAHDAPGTMYLSDAIDLAHEKLPAADTLKFDPHGASESRFNEITRWASMRQFDTGKFASRDNDFTVVSKELSADKGDPDSHELADLEAFEFPGGYIDGDDTDSIATVRVDELVGRRQRHWAFTHWPDVAVGKRFEYKGNGDGSNDGEYVIAGCTFVASHPGHEGLQPNDVARSLVAVLQGALDDDAVNADSRRAFEDLIDELPELRTGIQGSSAFLLTLLPIDMPWRPPRLTPRARMPGPQCAIVVGKSGEEIWTDKYGRVKVQFHWDRYGKRDENSSCWIRVSQPWAGKGWGSVSIPRIGQEVIVDFLEGDPDQPIIVGRFYNGESMPPYNLPGDAVVSGLKTNTHKGKGYNEMSMNDTAGKEGITIHGQYDMNTTVEHDQSSTIKNDKTNTVKNKFTETITSDTKITVESGTYTHDVAGNAASYHVKGPLMESYDNIQTTVVKNNITTVSTGGAIAIASDTQHIYIHAATSIQLHVGESMIWMDSGGQIKIKGVNVAIEGSSIVTIAGGIVHSEAKDENQTTGAIVLSKATGSNTIVGNMVMLNP